MTQMTWPTTPISTEHLDQGSDNPTQAREDIRKMADAVNGIADAFGVVTTTTPATDELLQWTGSAWSNQDLIMKNYDERITSLGTVSSGVVDIDFLAAPVQTLILSGNVTFAFQNANNTTAKSVTLWLKHSGEGRNITWPSGTLFAFGDRNLSQTADSIDMIHIQSVFIFGSTHRLVSILAGFQV
jgi:hypothetical protein